MMLSKERIPVPHGYRLEGSPKSKLQRHKAKFVHESA